MASTQDSSVIDQLVDMLDSSDNQQFSPTQYKHEVINK